MKRIQIDAVEPAAYEAMFVLEGYLTKSKLSATHKNLIKIRASQINGCAFCIDMHIKEAIKEGENPRRIYVLGGWRKTDLFSDEEIAILKMTEELTVLNENGLTDATYQEATRHFDEHTFCQIVMTIVTINSWNRIAISTHKPLP
ncbi:carboxymuconolactone decarboxylase family protein [Aquimarina gracilis]|uniref:Carboxymuconolactone decarboxylase family protein n=1 Tax=Aquimarina gracilis TaxID=874422 RepID=A0ABU5ZRQ1_9FLAO|nr:carboxymuconolactone decarboxylase family protein [Aquimarina gracilis]MEB3344756.1 carboxymuconolactone decarboxylase family protein [Aquimarina gracilis]